MMRPTLRTALLPFALFLLLAPLAHSESGGIQPSADEQHGIYTINRARSDPEAYGDQIGLDLTGVKAQPPLAVSTRLTASARFKTDEMLANDYFAHTSQVTGLGPNQYIVDAGYDLFANGLGKDWGTANNTESLAWGFNSIGTYRSAVKLLVIDEGVPSLGHRKHLLAMGSYYESMREIGCGRSTGGLENYYAIHIAWERSGDTFLTGIVYEDEDEDGEFDLGEGLGNVTVKAGGYQTKTLNEGGWSIRVPNGTYDLVCSGGGFTGTATARATVSGQNVEVDFQSGYPRGEVDFEWQSGKPDPREMRLLKAKIRCDYRKPYRDRIEIRGEIVLPEDFRPGDHDTAIRIGDFEYSFTLDVLSKTKDETGNRCRLKYSPPADGGPVGPGVAARVKMKIKGDFAADLASIGLENRDEERSAVELPISFVLDGQVFPCVGLFRIRATEGKKAAAKLER